jgi:hypothetical protein
MTNDMSKNVVPKVLADELGIDPKRLRAYLRATFARSPEAKNTSWAITPDAALAAREHFAKQQTPTNGDAPTEA